MTLYQLARGEAGARGNDVSTTEFAPFNRHIVHQIDPMITHKLKLEDINKSFELMRAGEGIRSVVVR